MSPAEHDEREALHAFEARLADALCSPDAGAAFESLRSEGAPGLEVALNPAQSDGFRIAALLVARLRFERLLHGSRIAGEAFAADGRTFTELFRRYHVVVPPTATAAADEAACFERWSREAND